MADVGEFVEQGVKVGAVDGVFFEDAGDGFGGAGAQDDARPRGLAAVGEDVRFDDGAGVVARFFDGGFVDFAFGEVAGGDVGAADGERARDLRFAARAEDDFGGAAADVDDEAAVGEVVVFADAEVDERRFFAAADDFDRFAERGFAGGEKGVAVFGDAQGVGGDRAEVVFGDVGDELSHLGQRFDAARDGFAAEPVVVVQAFAEAHHVFVFINGLDAAIKHLRDDEVEAVGAEIECCVAVFHGVSGVVTAMMPT